MKINIGLRLKNKATLAALASACVVFAASVAQALGVQLPVSQEQAMGLVSALLTVLAGLGVIVDPTTPGVSDSDRAMGYKAPGEEG